MRKTLLKTSLAVACSAMAATSIAESFITIGTGGQTGVYYVVGQSVCRLVNRDTATTGIKCNNPSTGGSVDNLNAIAAGERQMGTVQSDSEFRAYRGLGEFEGKKIEKLRTMFSIYPEAFTVVARADAGVKTFDDLKGKRVNIGNPGSGTRTTMEALMKEKGWTTADFAVAAELKPAEMASALCDNNLDVIAYTVGNPSGAIKEAAASCASTLVTVSGPEVDKLLADNSYFAKVTIPGGTYDGSPNDTDTLGVMALLVTSSDVPDEAVYQVTKAVFDNFERFQKLHPAFENSTPEKMVTEGISAPLAEGSKKYFMEKGWIK